MFPVESSKKPRAQHVGKPVSEIGREICVAMHNPNAPGAVFTKSIRNVLGEEWIAPLLKLCCKLDANGAFRVIGHVGKSGIGFGPILAWVWWNGGKKTTTKYLPTEEEADELALSFAASVGAAGDRNDWSHISSMLKSDNGASLCVKLFGDTKFVVLRRSGDTISVTSPEKENSNFKGFRPISFDHKQGRAIIRRVFVDAFSTNPAEPFPQQGAPPASSSWTGNKGGGMEPADIAVTGQPLPKVSDVLREVETSAGRAMLLSHSFAGSYHCHPPETLTISGKVEWPTSAALSADATPFGLIGHCDCGTNECFWAELVGDAGEVSIRLSAVMPVAKRATGKSHFTVTGWRKFVATEKVTNYDHGAVQALRLKLMAKSWLDSELGVASLFGPGASVVMFGRSDREFMRFGHDFDRVVFVSSFGGAFDAAKVSNHIAVAAFVNFDSRHASRTMFVVRDVTEEALLDLGTRLTKELVAAFVATGETFGWFRFCPYPTRDTPPDVIAALTAQAVGLGVDFLHGFGSNFGINDLELLKRIAMTAAVLPVETAVHRDFSKWEVGVVAMTAQGSIEKPNLLPVEVPTFHCGFSAVLNHSLAIRIGPAVPDRLKSLLVSESGVYFCPPFTSSSYVLAAISAAENQSGLPSYPAPVRSLLPKTLWKAILNVLKEVQQQRTNSLFWSLPSGKRLLLHPGLLQGAHVSPFLVGNFLAFGADGRAEFTKAFVDQLIKND